MNKKGLLLCSFLAFLAFFFVGCDESDEATTEFKTGVISTDWLNSNMTSQKLTIIDVRSEAEFSQSRIPNSINIPFEVPLSLWITMKDTLLLEIPELSEFVAKLSKYGITNNDKVVLVTSLPTQTNPYSLAAPTRAAMTLSYAGLHDIAILDGGFDKWLKEGKPVNTQSSEKLTPATFTPKTNENMFVKIDYVKKMQGKIILVDARDPEVYAGTVIEPYANKPGHIPGAVSLPAISLWNTDGTYKTRDEIMSLASKIIGTNKNQEIVLYCGVGGYASAVWFALTQILDYKNVKVYDGSAQEWVSHYDMVTSSAQ